MNFNEVYLNSKISNRKYQDVGDTVGLMNVIGIIVCYNIKIYLISEGFGSAVIN